MFQSKELLKETELRANALDANQRAYEASLRDAAYEIDELKAENVKLRPLLDRAKFLQYQVDSLIKMNDGYRKQLRNGEFAEKCQSKNTRFITIVCRKKKFKKSAEHEKHRHRASARNLR